MWLVSSGTAGLQAASDQQWLVVQLFLNRRWWSFSASVAWNRYNFIPNAKMGCISCSFLFIVKRATEKMIWGHHEIFRPTTTVHHRVNVRTTRQCKWRYSRLVYMHYCTSCICVLLVIIASPSISRYPGFPSNPNSKPDREAPLCPGLSQKSSYRFDVWEACIRNSMVASLPAC
jgi:hypothetical protein